MTKPPLRREARLRDFASARADLAEIDAYLRSRTGPMAASAVLKRLKAKIKVIQRTPLAGVQRSDLGEHVRAVVSQRWSVYYVVTDDLCRILRVLDGAREIGAIFDRP